RRRGERRPTAARVVLRVGHEELGSAARALVRAGLEDVVVLTCERSLRALLAQYVVLLGRELGAPFLICFLDLCHHLIQRLLSRKVSEDTSPWTRGRGYVKVRSSSPAGLRVGGTWHM